MELIEWMKFETLQLPIPDTLILAKATELLEKEREVIEEAYTEGFTNCPNSTYIGKVITAQDYFTKTFTKQGA